MGTGPPGSRGWQAPLTVPLFFPRSKIRIRDGRAKPIDLLAKYISAEDDDLAVEMHEPYTFLNGLTVSDMEDLVEDIQVPALPPLYWGWLRASSSRPPLLHFPAQGAEQVFDVLLVSCLQVYMELEQGKNVDFWRDMTIITEDEIAKLRKLEASGKGGPGKREGFMWVSRGV